MIFDNEEKQKINLKRTQLNIYRFYAVNYPFYEMKLHIHDEWEIMYVVRGKCRVTCLTEGEEKTYGLREGGYILAYNGGELLECRTGEVKFSVTIPKDRIPEIIGLSRQYKTAILTYEGEYIITESGDDIYVAGEARNVRMKVKEVPDMISYLTFPIVKLMMVGSEEQILKMEPVMREALGPEFSVFRSEAYHLEILPAGIDKGSGLLKTLDYLGIPREEAISCGDYDNDIPMNEAAGLGVAMANGCPEIKEKADYITLSNEQDGVALVIEKFMLEEE